MDSILYEQHSDADHHIYFAHSYGGNCPAHFHQASEILFVLKEKIVVTINDETRVLYPGELAVIPSMCIPFAVLRVRKHMCSQFPKASFISCRNICKSYPPISCPRATILRKSGNGCNFAKKNGKALILSCATDL